MSAAAPRILLHTRTTAYRHASIPYGIRALTELGGEHGISVDATEDPAAFEGDGLDPYDAVVFLSTSGEVLTDEGRERLLAHLGRGAGFLGIHAAACTEYDWPAYGELLGARFAGHPALQPGTVRVDDRDHPATAHLGPSWQLTDEWYDFRPAPGPGSRVLARADESTYEGGTMGADHPLVWCHTYLGARVFYTALGHTPELYAVPAFRAHLSGALRWVLGVVHSTS
ncbi:ThuA domain-containing protein [Streptomyces triticagri]|uniref:ThuA domain-containing protein n=1 Tax=Streptomyces triticagri TaxID=2293568 RepID=A0A372M3I3_9ACTN|nr:ThuA domain-containing protein [Streptomyces triticagri]RFU85494.1 ThuA domain-containing protein [Streptomyces triticagri]